MALPAFSWEVPIRISTRCTYLLRAHSSHPWDLRVTIYTDLRCIEQLNYRHRWKQMGHDWAFVCVRTCEKNEAAESFVMRHRPGLKDLERRPTVSWPVHWGRRKKKSNPTQARPRRAGRLGMGDWMRKFRLLIGEATAFPWAWKGYESRIVMTRFSRVIAGVPGAGVEALPSRNHALMRDNLPSLWGFPVLVSQAVPTGMYLGRYRDGFASHQQ